MAWRRAGRESRLDIRSPGFASDLWDAAQQSYSLDPVMGERKFGPYHVVVKTFLSNIRITTFFAGESEVKSLIRVGSRRYKASVVKWSYSPDGIRPIMIFDISC